MSTVSQYEFKAIPAGQINVDEALGIIECFVAGVGNKDSVGDVVLPGAFTESLKRRKPRVVWGHDWNHPIGKVLEIYEVGANDPRLPAKMRRANIGGLFAKVQFNLKSEKGREAFNQVAFYGEEQEWSIGYKTLDAFFDPSRKANMLKEVELYEVSPVLHGANQLTGTISIKSNEPLKDPDGGLTAAGRRHYNETEGSNLKPGVKGPADTPDKMHRKGSFLTRFFTNPSGPMKDENGKPTRLALSARAWGEPVPQNMEDARELAAKGRRMLDDYNSQKEKSYDFEDPSWMDQEDTDDEYMGPRGADGGVPVVAPKMGMNANLAAAISMRFGGNIRLRAVEDNLAVFDMMNEGESQTMRVTYHFDGDEFMFGEPKEVRAQTVYMSVDKPEEEPEQEKPRMFGDTDEKFMDFLRSVAEQVRANKKPDEQMKSLVEEVEVKSGRVLSRNNVNKLRQAIDLLTEVMATGGAMEMEMKGKELYIPIISRDVPDMKLLVDDLCDEHGLQAKAFDDSIIVSGEFTDEARYEIAALMDEYSAKVLRPQRFDPNAVDGDNDGTIQEGTPFARPSAPNVPSLNMTKPRTAMSTTTKPEPPKKSPVVQAQLDNVRRMTSSPFDADREFGDFNRRWQKHTVDGTMGSSDIVGMDRMYENLKKKVKAEGLDHNIFKQMTSQELNEFFDAIAYDKEEPDTRAEFLAMLMADFELGMRKIAKNRDKNGPQSGEPKIEVDKIIANMRSRMDK